MRAVPLPIAILLATACADESHTSQGPAPRIDSVEPAVSSPGEVVTIHGSGFGEERGSSYVVFGTQPVNDFPTVLKWSDERIECRIGRFVTASGELYVNVGGTRSRAKSHGIEPHCSSEEWTRRIRVAETAEALAVVATPDCGYLIAGRAQRFGKWDAFLLKLDASGAVDGGADSPWPRFYGDAGEDLALDVTLAHGGGYFFVGADAPADDQPQRPWFVWVNEKGDVLEEWHRPTEKDGPGGATAVTLTKHGYLVAGIASEEGSAGQDARVWRLGPAGKELNVLTHAADAGELLRPHAIAAFAGGYVLAGSSTTVEGINAITLPWAVRATGQGVELAEYVPPDGLRGVLHDARWYGNAGLFAGGELGKDADGAFHTLLDPPTLLPDFGLEAVDTALLATHAVGRGQERTFVAAGDADRAGGVLAQVDCVGAVVAEQRIESVPDPEWWVHLRDLAQPKLPNLAPYATVVVGFVEHPEGHTEVIAALRKPFPEPQPVIESFTVDGGSAATLTVAPDTLNQTLTLAWEVTGAEEVYLRKVGGPPEAFEPDEEAPLPTTTNDHSVTLEDVPNWECFDGDGLCSSITYELIAVGPGGGRCGPAVTKAQVNVIPEFPCTMVQFALAATSVMARFGTYEAALDTENGMLGPAHPDITKPPAVQNRCFTSLGLPVARLSEGTAVLKAWFGPPLPGNLAPVLDDREPGLLFFTSDSQGNPDTLAAWGLGTVFGPNQPRMEGWITAECGDWSATAPWFGHFGGWHNTDGGMSIVTPAIGAVPLCGMDFIRTPLLPRVCARPSLGYGILHTVRNLAPHPALWDLRLYVNPSGGLPLLGTFAGVGVLSGVPDPCALNTNPLFPSLTDAAFNSQDPNNSFFTGEVSTFFTVDAGGNPVSFPPGSPPAGF